MGYKVAVVGATGNVGREILGVLSERDFPADEVVALASRKSVGKELSFGEDVVLTVRALEDFDFSGVDFGLFSPGSAVSREHAPRAAESGCVVIDNTSEFRLDEDVPLIVPEVNREAIADFRQRNIIANPNCSTIQMVMALKPLHDLVPIKRIVVSTYQSVSGSGKSAMDELFNHTRAIFMNDRKAPEIFPKTIAFNVIPQIDSFMADGSTREETKIMLETQKILDPDIAVSATCVRVPTFIGHAEAVNIEFHDRLNEDEAREALAEAEGVIVLDKRADGGYVTPSECVGEDATFVSRIRQDASVPHGLNMWVVSDNLRKGAALNTVQIAEELVRHHMDNRH